MLLLFRRRCSPLTRPYVPPPTSSAAYFESIEQLSLTWNSGGGDAPPRMVRAAIVTDVAKLGTARISGILSQPERRSGPTIFRRRFQEQ